MNSDHLNTQLLHWGEEEEHPFGAVVPPIVQTSLFTYPDIQARLREFNPHGYDYTRSGNPTTELAERKIALIEGADRALCCGSGMGAITCAVMAMVNQGDHVVSIKTAYPPTLRLMNEYLPRYGVTTTLIDGFTVEEFEQACQPNTRLIYLETPSSMFFHLQDLKGIADLAKARDIVTIVDNSWATPLFQKPVALGIDLVVHSATKYMSGHSDIIAGVVAGSSALMERVNHARNTFGPTLDPFAAWLLIRGLRTLDVRMERHQKNGLQVASWLETQPGVKQVNHPGLNSHPQYELGRQQMSGYGSLFSVELTPCADEQAHAFVNSLRLFRIGCSWGGFESLVLGWPMREPEAGKRPWLFRLFIGLEHPEDLMRDLEQGLQKAFGSR